MMHIIRTKNPKHDLRLAYAKTRNIACVITLVLHVAVVAVFPEFSAHARMIKHERQIISVEDIPETQQIKRPPPPPRPAVPIETESDDVPDDVTIESTDLPFDEAALDLPPPPPPTHGAADVEQEEILEFYAVEKTPELIKNVTPAYPEIARKAGLEGTVFLKFVVLKNGSVENIQVLKGPEIFRQAAIDAVMQFTFKPAMQNDKPVAVNMTQPIRFRLSGG